MYTAKERKAYYNEAYHTTYSGYVASDGTPRSSTEVAIECARIFHEFFSPSSMLGCGCSTGLLLHGMINIDNNIRVAGFDISEFVVNHVYPDIRDKVIVWDISKDFPYQDEEFDLVSCLDVLEHLNNYEEICTAVENICRVSNKWIIVRTPLVNFSITGDKEINDWLETLNVLPHLARITLSEISKEIVQLSPDNEALEHPNEHPRKFWIALFNAYGYYEEQLTEEIYHMPNPLHINSFNTLVFRKSNGRIDESTVRS